MFKSTKIIFVVFFFATILVSAQKSNTITIKVLKVEHSVYTSSLYIDVDIKNESPNHIDRFFMDIYVYDKNGDYLGRTNNSILNLGPKKHTIETLYFENIKYNQIKKWEFSINDVLTIKNKVIEYYKDYTIKLIK